MEEIEYDLKVYINSNEDLKDKTRSPTYKEVCADSMTKLISPKSHSKLQTLPLGMSFEKQKSQGHNEKTIRELYFHLLLGQPYNKTTVI